MFETSREKQHFNAHFMVLSSSGRSLSLDASTKLLSDVENYIGVFVFMAC